MRRLILPVLLPLLLLCAGLAATPAPASGADTPVACTADDTSCDRCGPGRICCKLSGSCVADDLSDCPTSGGCFANGSCQIDDLCVVGSARPEPPPSPCTDAAPPACASCADGQYCCEADGRCVDPSQENGCAFTACFGAAGCDGTKMCEKGAVAPTPTPAPTATPGPTGTPGGPTASTPTPAPSGGTPTPGPTSSGGPSPAPGQCRTLELVNDTSEPIWIGGKGGAVVPSCITAQTSCLANVDRVSGDLATCGCSDSDGLSGTISCPTGSTAVRNASNALICRCEGTSCGGADDETTCATTGDGSVCFWTLPEPTTHGKSANKYQLLQGEKATFCLPQPADIGGKVAPVWWSGGVFARTGCADDGTSCATADCGAKPNEPCPPQNGGLKPLTLAEFTLQSNDKDFYDVTIIDGVNVAVEMKPIPPTQPTVPPGADPDYWCKGAGSTSASGRLDACSWDFKPVVPDPANPGSGTDYTSLLLYNGAQCGAEQDPTGCLAPSGSDPKESGTSYCTAPQGGSCLYPCSTDADCATHWGGAMKCKDVAFSDAETLKFCQCDETADCAGSKQGSYCGTQFFPGIKTQYLQVCGPKLRGWWTANDFCADASTKYGPLDCSARIANGQSGTTSLSQLFGCTGANAASCYNQGTTSNDCCGCATSPSSPFFSDWPAAASLACANGHNNPTWNDHAQPWLVFLKKGCPTAYTYAYDDSTSTFTCQSAGNLNEAGYTVTFGSIAAPALAECAATTTGTAADALATTAAGDSECTAFLSRAVGYRASLAGGTRSAATTIAVSDWIQSATFAVGRPQELLVREVSPDDVVWLSYGLARRPRADEPTRLGAVASDELGTHTLDTRGATSLLVPTGSGAVAGATPDLPLPGLFDGYTCYRVTPSAGAARPRLVDATYTDASGTHTAQVRDVPDSLCIEADLGDGLGQAQTSVACYAIRSTAGATTTVPRDGGVKLPVRAGDAAHEAGELAVRNRFGTATIAHAEQARELCVPVEIRDRGQLAP